jgi:hypothetical protein
MLFLRLNCTIDINLVLPRVYTNQCANNLSEPPPHTFSEIAVPCSRFSSLSFLMPSESLMLQIRGLWLALEPNTISHTIDLGRIKALFLHSFPTHTAPQICITFKGVFIRRRCSAKNEWSGCSRNNSNFIALIHANPQQTHASLCSDAKAISLARAG